MLSLKRNMQMGKRKLASVQYVHHITPIEGADRIECVHVLGWKCVANKGQFRVGDCCVYMEADSFLPICEQFEFLRSSSYEKNELLGEGFRLRTMKFRGQISQGLVQPLSILPEGTYKISDEVTELLGIRKWEVEERVTSSGTIIGEFPDGIPKTDELRVQSYPELIDEFKKINGYYISTKMDGTSVTMYRKDDHFGVCGRNFEYADDGKCAMWKYAHENGIPDRIKENNLSDLAIQGEFCGAGIQKNRLKLKKPEWYVFIAKKYNRYIMPDPDAYNGMFYRSDHFPFVQKGIPAMFAKGWNDNRKQGKEWAKEHIAHYWAETYHKPTDQTHPDTDDYSGLLQEVQLFFDLGYKLAQDTGYPKWKPKSEFANVLKR